MKYVFDTDCYTLAVRKDSKEYARIHSRAAELLPEDDLETTIVTYEEQTRGWLGLMAKARDLDRQELAYSKLKQHLQNYLRIGVLDFDAGAALKFEQLRAMRLRVGTADLKIAPLRSV